jgi:SPP1 family predicted phage head-tail adaptor
MGAGKYDHRLDLLAPTSTKDGRGGDETTYASVGKVWAERTDIRDAERVEAAQVGLTVTARFVVRSSSTTRQLDGTWQLECRGLRYSITGLKDLGRNEEREITAAALKVAVVP